jgi:hypothetical protein
VRTGYRTENAPIRSAPRGVANGARPTMKGGTGLVLTSLDARRSGCCIVEWVGHAGIVNKIRWGAPQKKSIGIGGLQDLISEASATT